MTTKLLAVDDSKTIQRVLEITFSGGDFQTTICGSAADALNQLQGSGAQVALVDASIKGESGYELCRRIKAAAPSTRVLILSSKHRPYQEAEGSAAGADGNFDKPFDSQKLIDKVLSLSASAGPAKLAEAPRPAAPPQVAAAPAAAPQRPAALPAELKREPAPVPVAQAPAPAVSKANVAPAAAAARPAFSQAARPAAAAPAQAVAAATAALPDRLRDLGLTTQQVEGVLSLSREVVEQVVWEVVPALAETLIKEEIARLTAD